MNRTRYGLHLVYPGIEYHVVVKISPTYVVISRSTNDQWSCCVINDDQMRSNSERAGGGKVVFLWSGVNGSGMSSILQSISSELTSQSLSSLVILQWIRNSPLALWPGLFIDIPVHLQLDKICVSTRVVIATLLTGKSMVHYWSFHHIDEPGPGRAKLGGPPQEVHVEMHVVCRGNNPQHID